MVLFQVFLKSDSLCLMEGEKGRRRPTLPDAHILALHIQQLEIGAFTMTSGAYKWPKLRSHECTYIYIHALTDASIQTEEQELDATSLKE